MVRELDKDLKYIENDIIAKQKNGLYCKYSKMTKSITVTNLSKENHLKYWLGIYKIKYKPEEQTEQFIEASSAITYAIDKKFKSGLISLDEIIELENNSKDTDKEKKKILEIITSNERPKSKAKNSHIKKNNK